jgi:hypothetical protein
MTLGRCFVLWRNGRYFPDDVMGIEPDRFRQLKEFHNIDTTAAGFDRRDDGLVSVERFGQVGLAHAGFPALVDDDLNKSHMPGRTKGFLHMCCRPLTKPTGRLNRNTDNQKIWFPIGAPRAPAS